MSDAYPDADLLYLTNPERREAIVNIQISGAQLLRVRINKDQLFALNAKSADILLKDFK